MPTYNRADTIRRAVGSVQAQGLRDWELVVVDDGSTDDTPSLIPQDDPRIALIRQENRGKGSAVRAAIPHADGDICVIQDADLEYDPADVPALIEPIVRGSADVVFGSRRRRPPRLCLVS